MSNQKAEVFKERANRYLKENDSLLKKNNLAARLIINFPKNIKVPFLSRIALWIVAKQGGQLDIQFFDIKK